MNAGTLKEIIHIYKPTLVVDDYGQKKEVFNKAYTTRAKVDHSRGNKSVENSEIVHNYNKSLDVRYYVKVDDRDQIEYQGKMYRVVSIEPIPQWNKKVIIIDLINE